MQKFLRIMLLAAFAIMPLATSAQYCTPNPSSKDGNGITNVTFGVGDETVNSNVTWGSSPYYIDNSSQIGAVPAGTTCEMSITFATGYTYGTIIWVDWNNDQTFSGTEVVWVGEAPNTNPTTLAVNFDIAPSQDTGSYRMRICAADSYFDGYTGSIASAASADPCASYTWGVGLDYTLHVLSAPTCTRPESLTATNVVSDGLTLGWVDTMNTGASYSIDYWKDGGDTNTVTSTTTSYTFTGLDANSLYHFVVKAVCSASDESLPLGGNFATACGGSTCDLTVGAWGGYSGTSYSPTLTLFQNGRQIASVNDNTEIVSVCSTDPVTVIFADATYTWSSRYASVYDGGGTELFNGSTDNYSTGDTLLTIATPCPTCIPPTALTAVPDSNEITFSWTPRSGASQFIVYLNDAVVDGNVTDTFYTFTGLPANTAFTLKVQSVCSADDSSNIATINTRTACGTITLPYFVDFEDAEFNGAWYPCWDSTIHAGTDPSVNTVAPHNSTYGMYFQGNSSENYNLVVSPMVPTAGNNIYVRFWGYLTNASGWMKAGVMTNPHDTSTFIPMVDIVGSTWNEYEFRTDTLDGDATYYIAWMACIPGASYNTQIGRVDDIYISEAPSCARVPVAYIDTTTSESITIRWDDNGMGSYTVYYWADGATDTLYESTSDTTVTISGLEPMTQYRMMVVANCSDGDAEPSPVYSAATTCADATCNITIDMVDNYYGYAWGSCNIEILQAGIVIGNASLPNYSESGSASLEVCSSAPVTFNFSTSYSYYSSYAGFSIKDGGGAVVYSAASSDGLGNAFFTLSSPCPDCVPPVNIHVGDITANEATLYWTAQEGQTSWIVRIDSTDYNVSDTSYTFTNLNARTTYNVSVATDCSGDTSAFISTSFTTDCATGSCDISVVMDDSYGDGWNGGKINFYQNDALAGSAGLTSGNHDTATVNVCSDIPVTFSWQSGNFDTEVSYVIYDGGFTEIYNSATSGVNYSDTIDDACPTCLRPTGLMVTIIDSNMLEFSWDVADSVDGYVVSFNGGAWENAAGAYSALSLSPNTSYTFSVKAVCSATDTSNPRSITVKTACGEMVVPYTNGFEDDAQSTVPSCWTVVRPGYGNYPGVSGSANAGSNGMTMAADYNDSTTIATSLVPLNGDEIYVSFWASVNQGNTLYAGVMTDLAYDTTFIPLLTVPYNNSTYTLYEFNTSTLSALDQYYVAFRLVTGGSNHYADIDDVEIRLDEGCMYPANLTANPGAHNMDLTWNLSTSSATFVVQHRQSGTSAWTEDGATFDTTYNVTGLNAATTYYFRVGFICNLDTLWSYTSAQTTCDMVNLPYYENFDSPTGTLPPCWDYTNPSYFHWNRWTTHAETSGDGELMVGSGSAGEYAILPEFNSSITKIQISFKAKLGNISEGDSVLFGVYDSYSNTVTQAGAMAIAGQSRENFVVFTYAYTNYSGSGSRIAIGHSHNNPSDWGMAVDSIVVIQLPDCLPPTDVEAHNTMYPNTADDVYFTWTGNPYASSYQIYIDTITSTAVVDSVPDSLLVSVDTNYYHVPFNSLAYGAHYRFFVRSNCGYEYGEWVELQNGFATDEVWMGNGTADTVIGCDFIVYDNGGPVAGYLHNSNSTLVMMSGEEGRELQVQGGWFSHGADANTFTIYDGVGTSGDVLYQRNQTNLTESVDTILATSTTGALTITFTSGYYAALGYELYVHCVGAAPCQRPMRLHAVMTDAGEASLDWEGTANSYKLYYKLSGATTWDSMVVNANNTTLTGLTADTNYDFYVVADCDSNGLSTPSVTVQFNTHYEVVITPCDPVAGLAVSNVTTNSAELSWTSTASSWELELTNVSGTTTQTVTTNPYILTGLVSNMQYSVRMRSLCNGMYEEPSSEWSTAVTFTTAGGTTPTFTITVQSNNEAWGTVTGGGTYNEGTVVNLTAIPADGYRFVQWNDANTENPRSVTVTANATYIATFEAIPTYTITAMANNPAWGTVTGGGTYQEGTEVTLTATANDGYQFVQWNDAVTDAVRTITVTANANYVATFVDTSAELVYHTVTVSVNDSAMGSVTGDGRYLEGTQATLTAVPNDGYRFVEWDDHNTDNPRVVTVNEDMALTAIFEAIPTYTITVQANNAAWGTVTGGGTYQEGTVITLVATANDGYHFVRWNDDVTTATRQVVVNANDSYIAYFEANVGINDVEFGSVSLYPNPASTSVTLGLEGFEGEANVQIVDMNGRVVRSANSVSATVTLDVADLPQGAYFVRVVSGTRTAVSKLIVK